MYTLGNGESTWGENAINVPKRSTMIHKDPDSSHKAKPLLKVKVDGDSSQPKPQGIESNLALTSPALITTLFL